MHVRATPAVLVAAAVSVCGVHAQPSASRRDMAGVFNSLYLVYDVARSVESYRVEHGTLPRVNGPEEFSRAILGDEGGAKYLVDSWGTPLHIESIPGKGYLIAAAGSDKTFNRATWPVRAATAAAEEDVVLRDGELIRSPVNWATAYVFSVPDFAEAGERVLSRNKYATTTGRLRALTSAIILYQVNNNGNFAVRDVDTLRRALVPKYTDENSLTDGWGHALAASPTVDGKSYVIVSAGPDGKFDKDSWNNPARATDDIILTSDGNIRNADPPAPAAGASGSDTDRLLEAWASFRSALQRFEASRR